MRCPGGGLVYSRPLYGRLQATPEQEDDTALATRSGLAPGPGAIGPTGQGAPPAEDENMTTVATASAVRAMPAERASRLVWWLAALFFLSGASGLIYQVLWVRMLSLSFGITVYAVTVVLASFMGGLALGSFFGGRLAERIKRPLLAYGIIEVVVALVALATPYALTTLQSVYPAIARAVGEDRKSVV